MKKPRKHFKCKTPSKFGYGSYFDANFYEEETPTVFPKGISIRFNGSISDIKHAKRLKNWLEKVIEYLGQK